MLHKGTDGGQNKGIELFSSHLPVNNFCVHNKKTNYLMLLRAVISVCLRKVLSTYCPQTNTRSLLGI